MIARVLVVDRVADEGLRLLRHHGLVVDELGRPSDDVLRARLPDYDVLLTRSGTTITADLLEHGPRLQVVARAGVGVDNIDVEACSRRGIVVLNVPAGNVVSAAEHTMAMMLALVRRLADGHAALKALRWDRSIYGTELFGKTIGIVGLGRVGSRVAARLRGFEATVLACDPYVARTRAEAVGAELVEFRTLLTTADIVTFHVPLNAETRRMLAAPELAVMKRGVRLLNCARGGIIDEDDLLDALDSGHVAAAAIDVWSEEPPRRERLLRLVQHPAVVVTPHLGANSEEAQVRVALDVARQIVAYREGSFAASAVNMPCGDLEGASALAPFVTLADRLGRFCAQLADGPLRAVEITVGGPTATPAMTLLGRAVLAGLLSSPGVPPVNLVNAHLAVEERGIRVATEVRDDTAGYADLVTAAVETAAGRWRVEGTVFSGHPRIVRVGDWPLEFSPEGFVLMLAYEDRPGVVGRVGSLLGRHGINIAAMQVGRRERQGGAVLIMRLDDDLGHEQLREVAHAAGAGASHLIRLGDIGSVVARARPAGARAGEAVPA